MLTDNDQQLNIVDGEQLNAEQKDVETLDNIEQQDIIQDSQGSAAAKKKHSKWEIAVNIALWAAIVILAVMVVLRVFVFCSVRVDGESMTNTYKDGDVVVVNKLAKPKRGDVVVIYLNDVKDKFKAQFAKDEQCAQGQPYEKLIKRVVATEGDKIWAQSISDNGSTVLYEIVIDTADGNRLFEDYYVKKGETLNKDDFYVYAPAPTALGLLATCTENNPFVVSKDCIFIMGDHRYNSRDSREFGEFPLSRLFGVVLDK